ncbi:PREDICTED: uncharacterized protein LOC106818476 [Priapulus caudatus]|uniref:Uncharacterized protein LOC106818476 n=1 Tax=Priapulus caudatus TaxID=37621 RepID=A0ABM1F2J4_PRICU|nr:PREDICTED: uncharacterized protein LOC106818476 [Priapulus caudatus]
MTQGTRQNALDGKLQVTVQNKLNRLRNARQQQVNAQRGVNLGGGVTASEHVARNRAFGKAAADDRERKLADRQHPKPAATAARRASPRRSARRRRKQKPKRLSVQQEVAEIQRSNPHYLYDIGAVRPAASALSLNDRFYSHGARGGWPPSHREEA